MICFKILNFTLRIFIKRICDAAIAPTVITISDSTLQHLFTMFFISGWYFSNFVVIF